MHTAYEQRYVIGGWVPVCSLWVCVRLFVPVCVLGIGGGGCSKTFVDL